MFSTVIIGGGTGFVGKRLRNAFSAIATQVLSVSRTSAKDCITWDSISKNGVPEGTDVVINVAGENVLNPLRLWSVQFKKSVISSRVDTTRMLAKAIDKCAKPPKVFITMSGVNYYKAHPSEEYTEYKKVDSFDFFSDLCKDWENAGSLSQKTTRRVIIRSGVVLGREGGMISQIWFPFFVGFGGIIGSGKQYMPWIHADDLTKLFVFAAQNEKVEGILNGVAPQVVTNYEFTKSFGNAMRRPTIVPLPEFAVKTIFGSERAMMLLEGAKVIPKRVTEFGFKYTFADIGSACKELTKM